MKTSTQTDDHEPSEAECALHLLRMGFMIVKKDSTTPVTIAELERVVAREAQQRQQRKQKR